MAADPDRPAHTWGVVMFYALSDDEAAASVQAELAPEDQVTLTNDHLRASHGPFCIVCQQPYPECWHSPCPGEPEPAPLPDVMVGIAVPIGDVMRPDGPCPGCGVPLRDLHTFGCPEAPQPQTCPECGVLGGHTMACPNLPAADG